jgi:NAD(P)H dehydrogenase (quinone)
LQETAQQVSSLTGRHLRYVRESVDEGRAWRTKLGAPAWEVDTWLGSYEAIAAGELEKVSCQTPK